ncbi:class I SAM-dependent rRNA methyltransferase [Enterococcus sp. CWB-B31]|uniref:class I SAM-dependent rRNA methyltransferase n=1 Tax=Enterococcus sp. CWB-B31 TaxID=2885159 RepID=UPI001E33425D|nr:class I SAM-dependent rRNA methyltransferase [Enterococcus sp. CWB-B31]MCB5955282.1 class I SAM-dependent rRNA methyltransferase [Enterococcus sp. CWB-B31]
MKIQVTKQAVSKLMKGCPLIQEEDLLHPLEQFPKEWVTFTDSSNRFIAYGYLANQNKGIGWLLSWKNELTASFFDKLFLKAKEARSFYFNDDNTTAFRLFNGEGDGLGGLTVDCYNEFAVFSWYNDTIYANREMIIASFRKVFKNIEGAYEKIRFSSDQLPESQKMFGKNASEPLIIVENGVSYAVYLNEGLMTGIFLDQKDVRSELVNGYAAGKQVLNMFSYTGAFSVAAAMGGAAETTSVDLAKRSSPKTAEQFAVNQFPLDHQKIVVMDVFEYFNYAKRKAFTFDCIILDPPSFARNKKKVFTVAKNYGDLVKQSVDILSNKGSLIASTNAANISLKRFKKMVEEALCDKNVRYKIEEIYQLPADFKVNPDFSEGNYLKVLLLRIEK